MRVMNKNVVGMKVRRITMKEMVVKTRKVKVMRMLF